MKSLSTLIERQALKTKLLLGFLTLMMLAMAIGVDALIGQRLLGNEIQKMYEIELLGVSAIKDAQIHYIHIARIARQYVLAPDAAERDRLLKQLGEAEAGLKTAIEAGRERLMRNESRAILAKFEESYALYRRNIDRLITSTLSDFPKLLMGRS